ncbi:YhgE/Pip domain-containing protein [Pseudoclavibacter chungangensis]|uniref:YhgE/Pip domain-containing protein n=1 Tax=Pseudoclavibacter chungangensis TaxID=587635 RepID=A0A7J5BV65_9MICO|nr:YhgE/Pip domain-containing protein [Pseudoclavibacter chungangensis]KAB1658014.1 YhgE/Pip domain-containing protein [Pseudoclavibacter chungangensis]NYJ65822.1 putative membrane protein [Pseudoclavibacter chungangensis]
MTERLQAIASKLHISPRVLIVLFGLSIIPLIYAGALIWSNEDPTHRLDTIPAAIVNLDQPAVPAVGDPIHLGDSLTDELLSTTSETNFAWQELDAQTAQSRLESGDVLAVLTIPEGFSAAAASLGGDDPAAARQGRLQIETNDGANLIVGNIASTVGTAVADALATQVSEQYLGQIYAGFSKIHTNLTDAEDGASQLADGAATANDGADELVVGLGDLRTGASQASSGAQQLAAGSGELADGAQQLGQGATTAADGAGQLADGAQRTNAGAQQLSDGLTELNGVTSRLPAATQLASDGAGVVATGARTTATDAQTASTTATTVAEETAAVAAALDAYQPATGGTSTPVDTTAVTQGASGVASGASGVSDGIAALAADADGLTPEELQARLAELQTQADGVSSDATTLESDAEALGTGGTGSGGETPADTDPELAALRTQAHGAADDAATLQQQSATVQAETEQVAIGTEAAYLGTKVVVVAMEQLSTAVSGAAQGAAAVADGTAQVSDGSTSLQSGVQALAQGTTGLQSGAEDLESGASQLADGTGQLADGASQAQDGASQLADGTGQLADGSSELQNGLANGASQVPNYTDSQAQTLATAAAAPVGIDTVRQNKVPGYGAGLAPYFMALGLWVGAMAFYLMMPAINERLLASRRGGFAVALRSWLPGAMMAVVQAMLMVLTVHVVLGVPAANPLLLVGVALLTGITFIAINQAFISLLGAPGRFLALMMVVLQLASAGGTYPVQTAPEPFQVLHGILPLTATVESFRSLIAGGTIGLDRVLPVLLTWLFASLAITWIAVALKRRAARAKLTDGPGEGAAATGRGRVASSRRAVSAA